METKFILIISSSSSSRCDSDYSPDNYVRQGRVGRGSRTLELQDVECLVPQPSDRETPTWHWHSTVRQYCSAAPPRCHSAATKNQSED